MAILEIENLVFSYRTSQGELRAVDEVSLTLPEGRHLGLIGESGCGKTSLLRAITRVSPPNGRALSGRVLYKDIDLNSLSDKAMRELRWREIAVIPQASMDSLDPVQRVGKQFSEILRVRGGIEKSKAKTRAVELFERVGLEPGHLERFPHELSGGMKQRAIIAMALALNPSLLIADEPVTALDVIVQAQILALLKELQESFKLTVIFITHDVSVVAQNCEHVAVMYAGKIVESAPAKEFFETPRHPYSLGLQRSFPTLAARTRALFSIAGQPPNLISPPPGCRFAPRCSIASPDCEENANFSAPVDPEQFSACIRTDAIMDIREDLEINKVSVKSLPSEHLKEKERFPAREQEPFLEIDNLSKVFFAKKRFGSLLNKSVQAVDGVSFSLRKGEALGLAGESGSGKTTTAKILLKLLSPTGGEARFCGADIAAMNRGAERNFRRRVQLMFQNPFEALNPRFSLYRSLEEPLIIHQIGDSSERRSKIMEILEKVRFPMTSEELNRFPHELSGGQLQRVTLARALILEPELLIADEPVSMLDISVRAGILNTMRGLAETMNLTSIYISHDLSLLGYTCQRIAVMQKGKIVEIGPVEKIISAPEHPYTQALLAAAPSLQGFKFKSIRKN
mgnify:CR=1 FL=1